MSDKLSSIVFAPTLRPGPAIGTAKALSANSAR